MSHTPNVFAVEPFIDKAALTAERDPLAFRPAHLRDDRRHVHVLREAAARELA